MAHGKGRKEGRKRRNPIMPTESNSALRPARELPPKEEHSNCAPCALSLVCFTPELEWNELLNVASEVGAWMWDVHGESGIRIEVQIPMGRRRSNLKHEVDITCEGHPTWADFAQPGERREAGCDHFPLN